MAGVPSLTDFLDDPELIEFNAAPYFAVAPAPSLLFQCAEQDENVPRERAQEFYDIAREPKSIEWYPTTHRFVDLDAARDRAVWLREQLG